ncbi:MAG: YifB family Mg chelatase-like AAA ATPase [Pseudomonadota bacterium]
MSLSQTHSVSRVQTLALVGMSAADVEVEVQLSNGLPSFAIVGLPDKAVAESRERIRAAFSAIGLALPPRRITVNLAPADVGKEGSHYDLPIALGLLMALGVVPSDTAQGRLAIGELGLDASLRAVPGVLVAAVAAAERGLGLICPASSGAEAAWLGQDVDILAPRNLLALVNHVSGHQALAPPEITEPDSQELYPDLADVRGQESAKRALEIAAAGAHNLLMIGPPGAGKSMLAARLAGLLPPLDPPEILEVGMIHSIGGRIEGGKLSNARPFRNPHHAASMAAMVGGGTYAKPGEISLAHKGVLFLDELPEFSRSVLEALRQPLESGKVTIARANGHATYPSRFQLIAAMNPCRCGYIEDPAAACSKAPKCAADYQNRISGPIFDRIDMHIEVPALSPEELSLPKPTEGSAEVRARVIAARTVQVERFAHYANCQMRTNTELEGDILDDVCKPAPQALDLLRRASERLRLTARGYFRVLRVARTIADLDGAEIIGKLHVAEAVSFRRKFVRQP